MRVLKSEAVFYRFEPDRAPALVVDPGETIAVEVRDCFNGAVKGGTVLGELDLEHINPLTGPIAVRGCRPGDVLAIRIEDVVLASEGVMMLIPPVRSLVGKVRELAVMAWDLGSGLACLRSPLGSESGGTGPSRPGRRFSPCLPVEPMVGTIGTTPSTPCPTWLIREHGGNMDNKDICPGSTVYLPVFTEGGGVGIGDLHAFMADGEIASNGVEVAGTVVLKLEVLHGGGSAAGGPGYEVRRPWVETPDYWISTGSGLSMGEAMEAALDDMISFVRRWTDLGWEEALAVVGAFAHPRVNKGGLTGPPSAGTSPGSRDAAPALEGHTHAVRVLFPKKALPEGASLYG